MEIEWHRSIFTDAKGANDFGFAGFGIVFRDAKPVFLMEREDQFKKFFIADASAEFAVKEVAGGLGERGFVNFVYDRVRVEVHEREDREDGSIVRPST